MAASAGRVVIVGMGPDDVALRVGSFTEKELDVLGTSMCNRDEFAEAVALVERNGDRLAPLVTHEFPLDRAPEALVFAMENPTDVMKVVIRGRSPGSGVGTARGRMRRSGSDATAASAHAHVVDRVYDAFPPLASILRTCAIAGSTSEIAKQLSFSTMTPPFGVVVRSVLLGMCSGALP